MKINSLVWWGNEIFQVYGLHCNAVFLGEPFTKLCTAVVPHKDYLRKVHRPAKKIVKLLKELRGGGTVLLYKGEEIYSVIRDEKILIVETKYDIHHGNWRDIVTDIAIK